MRFFLIFLSFFFSRILSGQEYRVPSPEFSVDYELPVISLGNPESLLVPWLDLVFLLAALVLTGIALYKYRCRLFLFIITGISLFYLGFLRKGCICPVGSIQPVIQTFFDSEMILPINILLVFLIPLVCALFFGRLFCGSVCPLGAVQELAATINARIPPYITSVLKLIPPAYLILAGIAAATGSDYLICRYDPFIGFFRSNFSTEQLPVSIFFLVLSIIVYRPYCRFICPYGWLLGLASKVAIFKVKAVKKDCINCRLCASACPADAVKTPDSGNYPFMENRKKFRRLLLLTPFLIILGGITGYLLAPVLSPLNRDVSLLYALENPAEENSLENEAFLAGEISREELNQSVQITEVRWQNGMILGVSFFVLAIMIRLLLKLRKNKTIRYEADPANCFSCGRCYQACPKERILQFGPIEEDERIENNEA